ncbi:MAG: 30S ribosomal protein S1 [Bacteroidetes bacterium]|nr:30S ribosomal protein S1 [Bacteroidota bacterium]
MSEEIKETTNPEVATEITEDKKSEETKANQEAEKKVETKVETEDKKEEEEKSEIVKKEEVKEKAEVEAKTEAETEAKVETEAKAEVKVKEEEKIIDEDKAKEEPDKKKEEVVVEVEEVKVEAKEEIKMEEPVETKPEHTPSATTEPPSFDWDSVGKKQDIYTLDERQKLENLYDNTLKSIVEHEVLDGTVVSMSNREVVVNIGFKSDGVIPLNELRYNPDLKVGDEIEVYVENQEDPTGQLVLSHKKARILRSWERINKAYDKDEIINGYVKCRTKGGLIVDVFGIEAFLPGSQIDVKPIRDYDVFVDKTMEFKVVKINHEYKNVVVSHKALIEDELEAQKIEIMSKLEKGQVLEGTVKNITSYGVFIDLGGVDGLIHITDLSWGRINHPDEIVELDQKIKVAILDFDDNKKRIALGLKQLTPHPWESLDTNLKIGDNVKGKVVVIADYGAFVEIAAGVEGLIHVSEMSWSQHLRTAQDFLKVGDEVEAVILTLDREERKMSLGIKQLIPDPWINIKEKYPVNSKHTAIVRNFTNFGIFVELEEGVDGLIHISDLSWSKKIKHPAEFTKIGENIEVVVLDVDEENRRLSLGHKQLEENPWDVFETVFTVDSVHKGTIIELFDKGAVIALPYGVEGFAPKRHLAKEDEVLVKIDESLDFKVIEFSKENKKIILSHTKVLQDVKAEEKAKEVVKAKKDEKSTKRAIKKVKDSVEKSTLGDIEALATLKSDMEQKAKAKLEKMAKEKKGRAKKEETKEEGTKKEETKKEETKKEETKKEETKKEDEVKK